MGTTATDNPLFQQVPKGATERIEWARLAASRAHKERWRWQAYVQMMTRNNKLKLAFTTGVPRTDGETIWLRVPIELGNPVPHSRKLCGERGDNLIQLCDACAVNEDVQITMYHEVAHISFDSFAQMTEFDKISALFDAYRLEAGGMPPGKRLKKIEQKLRESRPMTFVEATKHISPWFGILLNVAEDGRVNKRMMDARPGTKKMFAAQTTKIFEQGLLADNGEVLMWKDQPPNNQALIAIYCKIFGLDYSTWFAPQVVEDLNDWDLDQHCLKLATARSVHSVYKLCIPTLERLRELGYCKSPDDEEDDPEEGPGEPGKSGESGSSDESSDSSSSSKPDNSESDSGGGSGKPDKSESKEESDDQAGSGDKDTDSDGTDDPTEDSTGTDSVDKDGDESDDENDASKSSDESDDSDDESEWDGSNPEYVDTGIEEIEPYTQADAERDGLPDDAEEAFRIFGRHDAEGHVDSGDSEQDKEEIERALIQVEYFDAPSVQIYGVQVHKNLEGDAWSSDDYYGRKSKQPIKIEERILAPALMRLRIAFADNKRGTHVRNLTSGRVNGGVLGRRVPVDDMRLFERKIKPGKKDWFVLIGLDVSGSTSRPGVIELIKSAAYAKAELCNRLGVKFAVLAHTGEMSVHSGSSYGMDLAIYEIKSPHDRWDIHAKDRLNKLGPSSANLDGHTLEYYRKVAQAVKATDKIIMYYTDGAMPMENYAEELDILQREIEMCRRLGINIVGVGIKNDDPTKHGLDTIRLDRIEDVPKVVTELEKRLHS
jgi:hypothetical protein